VFKLQHYGDLMKALRYTLLLTPLLILILGCTQEETNRVNTFHFQGQDCLHCHNVDLEQSSHLNIGVTIYSETDTVFESNITQVYCTQPLFVQLIDINNSIVLDTNISNDPGDPGFNGKGNIFSLSRKEELPNGNYYIKVVDSNGTDVIEKSIKEHKFSGTYDPDSPSSNENRYSCNACHSIAGSSYPLKSRINCMETK